MRRQDMGNSVRRGNDVLRRGGALVVAAPLVAMLMAGCSSGPAAVSEGTYRAFAASSEIGAAPDASVTVADATYTFTPASGEAIERTSTPGTTESVVCPPDTRGTPASLGAALTLGDVTLQKPAVIGDCGQTAPTRITVVDLASASTDVAPFPFTRWIEFCDTTDPDC